MRTMLSKFLSRSLEAAVIGLVAMATTVNFLIIAQALFSPLSVVRGNSMYPYIEDGDAVLAVSVQPEEIRQGDVVIFPDPEQEGCSIVHRVVSLEEKEGRLYAVTKGDGNPEPDPQPVSLNRVLGKVKLVIPMGGAFLEFIRSPRGFITSVILPFAVLLLYLLTQRYKEKAGEGRGLLLFPILRA